METVVVLFILAVVQGVAEFLPVSSSGHLVLFEHMPYLRDGIGAMGPDLSLFINVLLHVATLIAVVIFLWKDIVVLAKGFFSALARRDFSAGEIRTVLYILAASAPAGLIGMAFHDFFESLFSSPFIVCIMLIINGFILISTKIIPIKNRQIEEMGITRAILVGCAQAVAIIPGISRSGSTITGGFLAGLEPAEAAKFSFYMAIPVILGAGLVESLKVAKAGVPAGMTLPLAGAFVVAVLVALAAIELLFVLVKRVRIDIFGYYTIIAGTVGIIILHLAR
jgi:undecaprenyl-diphosphatase